MGFCNMCANSRRGPAWLQNLKDFIFGSALGKSAQREPLYLEMLGAGLGRGPITMISIGSSDGVEGMYALKHKQHDVTLHLLEPDPSNMAVCQQNISRLFPEAAKQVHFHNVAVSNRVANGSFFRNPEAPNLNSANRGEGASEEIHVRYTTLDLFLKDNQIQAPVIINMDIEGHEVEVLEGFLGFASTNHGIKILMEVHPSLYTQQHSLERILEKYFSIGFRATYVESAGVPIPEKFRERGLKPVKTIKNRALYANLDNAFVLEASCHEHMNKVDASGRISRKIVRSLLIEKN